MNFQKYLVQWKPFKSKKTILLLASLLLLVSVGVGTTAAYLIAGGGISNTVKNTFDPSTVSCEVNETFKNNTKSNVYITNTGDTDAYIRAAVVVTWRDAKGHISAIAPVAGTDYQLPTPTGWKKGGDGYYYHTTVVSVGAKTEPLIESLTPLTSGPKGTTLHVEIIASAIQSTPTDAVTIAWGVTLDDTNIDGRA